MFVKKNIMALTPSKKQLSKLKSKFYFAKEQAAALDISMFKFRQFKKGKLSRLEQLHIYSQMEGIIRG